MKGTLISEILIKVFINCDKETINNARIVCKQWNSIINQDSFWKEYYLWNYSSIKGLNELAESLPNHSYANLCRYKLENKEKLNSNIEDENGRKMFTLLNLNDYNIHLPGVSPLLINNEVCIKHDRFLWLKKDENTVKYLEFKNPNNIRTFTVGRDPVRKVSLIENLVVCITDSHSSLGFAIHIFSVDDRYKDLHLTLTIRGENSSENGNESFNRNGDMEEKIRYIDSFIEDNLVIVLTTEMANKAPIFIAGMGWVEPMEEECTTMIWDFSKLIDEIKRNEHDEFKLYEKISHIKVPGVFTSNFVKSCPFTKKNETSDKFEKYYYVMCNGNNGEITRVDILDEFLRQMDNKTFENKFNDPRNRFKSSYICPDGTIIISCDRSITITFVDHLEKQIVIPYTRRSVAINIMQTPDLLYILNRSSSLAKEEISLVVINNSDIKESENEIPYKTIHLFEYDFGISTYNKFLDTGLIHYSTKTNQIIFCPFSKIFI